MAQWCPTVLCPVNEEPAYIGGIQIAELRKNGQKETNRRAEEGMHLSFLWTRKDHCKARRDQDHTLGQIGSGIAGTEAVRIADWKTARRRVGREKVRIASRETVSVKTVWIAGRETVRLAESETARIAGMSQ